jgi:D-glycero-D-manno-heptose 1,7-bisphosphate phosphatase
MSSLPVFLDRDGVINRDSTDYIRSLDQWVPFPGVFRALAALSAAGHPLIIVTNQSAVSRGFTSVDEVEAIHDALLGKADEAGAVVSGIYYCPHQPEDRCSCRKPAIGMIEAARRDLSLPEGGWMIGDASSDMELGRNAGLETILVLTGRGADQLEIIRCWNSPLPSAVVDNLCCAVDYILEFQTEQ